MSDPLKGWCPYADAGPLTRPYPMTGPSIAWRDLKPCEGECPFDAWG
ncbi:MAG: hypothetical protein H8F28_06965 [Fibrella sp.]|nr:hypothetical protein [Armatimonadota bacterium]